MPRTVIIAHGHPKFRLGGGEIAAYRHFEHMVEKGEDAFFVGSIKAEINASCLGPAQYRAKVGARDFVLRMASMDPYLLNFQDIAEHGRFLETLLAFDADIYHFHHLWNIGAKTVERLMRAKPAGKFVLTLHEYLLICAHHGQMVKAHTNELCFQSDPIACSACMPQHRPAEFFLRRLRLFRLLEKFDLIISPSNFLRDRFETWGIQTDRIKVVENGMPEQQDMRETEESENELLKKTHHFAFFGMCTPTKGLDILVRAGAELARRGKRGIHIDILGVTLEQFRAVFPDVDVAETVVRFLGPYQPQHAITKMQGYGWIVVPSIWWENSPLVIQEAKLARTPVIAANIGGMKEKVSGWGKLFEVGDHYSLADAIEDSAGNAREHKRLRNRINGVMSMDAYHNVWTKLVDGIRCAPA